MNDCLRKLTLIAMLLVALVAYANPVKKINDIKRDSLFIYGEATKHDSIDAYNAALNILQSNMQLWYEENGKTGKILRNMTFLADTISAMREGYHRVFAYVSIEKLEKAIQKDEEIEAEARKGLNNAVNTNVQLHSDPQTDAMMRELIEKASYQDFVKMVMQKQQEGLINSASRDITRLSDGSFLAIFSQTKKGYTLIYLLAPGENFRYDLKTGQQMDQDIFLQNRDTYRFLWFVPSINSKQ